jgi:hypothetical protein
LGEGFERIPFLRLASGGDTTGDPETLLAGWSVFLFALRSFGTVRKRDSARRRRASARINAPVPIRTSARQSLGLADSLRLATAPILGKTIKIDASARLFVTSLQGKQHPFLF